MSVRKNKQIDINGQVIIKDSFSTFMKQAASVAVALFAVTVIPPGDVLETGFTTDYFGDTGFVSDTPLETPNYVMNEEGFLLKSSTQGKQAARSDFRDSVKHTVVSGDTLSGIARLYGVNVKTLLWENGLGEMSTLKIGQNLTIPPIDGITHTAAKNDTIVAIAKRYSVDEKVIREYNNLKGDVITPGQKLFVPGGKKKQEVVIARSGVRSGGRWDAGATFVPKTVKSGGTIQLPTGLNFIFPTKGEITQGFRPGHYAIDIANPRGPDVVAARGGTVIDVVTGCPAREVKVYRNCGGGFGNYVKVDHGNGAVTLYAHLRTVYVAKGESLETGQAVGQMGNSGRAYGVTGIHTHVELYVDGAKKNFMNYVARR